MCSRSSAARRSICSRCFRHRSECARSCATPHDAVIFRRDGDLYRCRPHHGRYPRPGVRQGQSASCPVGTASAGRVASKRSRPCSGRARPRPGISDCTAAAEARRLPHASCASRCCGKAMPIGVFVLTPHRSAALHRQADRAGRDLRRPGRDRHRECPPVRRGAGAHRANLPRSLEDLRTAQDRLVQTEKLASLGQLTAGIAHEIKNPLNFVNNFSALSGELIDELQRRARPAHARRQDCARKSTS